MKAYATQAEYNGFASGIEDDGLAWTKKQDWIAILDNAKETFLEMAETYKQGLDIDRMVFALLENRK